MDLEVTIITYREIFQYEVEKKNGRSSEDYKKLSASIALDKGDMAKAGIKPGQYVSLSNEIGQVVVAARISEEDEPHPGIAFMITSPWSNQLIREDICNISIPGYKRVSAKVSPSGEAATHISDLFKRITA